MPTRRPHPPAQPPVPPPVPVAPPPKPRRKRHWFRNIVLLMFVALFALVGAGVWVDMSLNRFPALVDYPDRPAAGAGTTWLLVGSDSRDGLTPERQAELTTGGDVGGGRTDTILLVHVPGLLSNAPPVVVSIPRDSYVPIPGFGRDKINAAFALGGPQLLAETVEQATGIRLDHYAEVGFAGFADVVDAVGGVEVCPTEPIDDPLAGINLPAGCQQLDGPSALGYVRTRATPRADLDRVVHQRQFISALTDRATSPSVFLNPWRWFALPGAAIDALMVDEDAHVWDLAGLAWALHGSPVTATVPISEFTYSDSGAVVIWNKDLASRLFAALAADQPVPADVLADQP